MCCGFPQSRFLCICFYYEGKLSPVFYFILFEPDIVNRIASWVVKLYISSKWASRKPCGFKIYVLVPLRKQTKYVKLCCRLVFVLVLM